MKFKNTVMAGLAGLLLGTMNPAYVEAQEVPADEQFGSNASIETRIDSSYVDTTAFGRLYDSTVEAIMTHSQENNVLVSYDTTEQVPVQAFRENGTEVTYALEDSLVERGWSSMINVFNEFTGTSFDTANYDAFHSYIESVAEEYGTGGISFQHIENPMLTFALEDLGAYIDRFESYQGTDAEELHTQLLRVGVRDDEQTGILYTIYGSESADSYQAGLDSLFPEDVTVGVIRNGELQREFNLDEATRSEQSEYVTELMDVLQTINNELRTGPEETYGVVPAAMNQPVETPSEQIQENMYELDHGIRAYDLGDKVRFEVPNPEQAQSGILAYQGITLKSSEGNMYTAVPALDDGDARALSFVDGNGSDEINRGGQLYQTFTFDKEELENQLGGENTLRFIPYASDDGKRALGNNPQGYTLDHLNFTFPEDLY